MNDRNESNFSKILTIVIVAVVIIALIALFKDSPKEGPEEEGTENESTIDGSKDKPDGDEDENSEQETEKPDENSEKTGDQTGDDNSSQEERKEVGKLKMDVLETEEGFKFKNFPYIEDGIQFEGGLYCGETKDDLPDGQGYYVYFASDEKYDDYFISVWGQWKDGKPEEVSIFNQNRPSLYIDKASSLSSDENGQVKDLEDFSLEAVEDNKLIDKLYVESGSKLYRYEGSVMTSFSLEYAEYFFKSSKAQAYNKLKLSRGDFNLDTLYADYLVPGEDGEDQVMTDNILLETLIVDGDKFEQIDVYKNKEDIDKKPIGKLDSSSPMALADMPDFLKDFDEDYLETNLGLDKKHLDGMADFMEENLDALIEKVENYEMDLSDI